MHIVTLVLAVTCDLHTQFNTEVLLWQKRVHIMTHDSLTDSGECICNHIVLAFDMGDLQIVLL